MSNYKLLGRLFLANLMLNCEALSRFEAEYKNRGDVRTMFMNLPPKYLYSRLLATTKFDSLPQYKKDEFIFKKFGSKDNMFSDREVYDAEMQAFVQEAHNRTCKALGVKPTVVRFLEFSKQGLPDTWAAFSTPTDEILLNVEKDYSITRPSLLVELINSMSKEHAIHANILTAMKNPEALSDFDYFVSVMTAVRCYIYDQMHEYNSYEELASFKGDEGFSPMYLTQTLYSFSQTRKDFQEAELYGGAIQEGLRRNEVFCYNNVSDSSLSKSLIATEDLIGYFDGTMLNEVSNELMGKILKTIINETATKFYNKLGADMKPNESVSDYIDRLEDELYEEKDIEKPTDEEALEYMGSTYGDEKGLDEEGLDDDENSKDLESESEDDEDLPFYRAMENVIPDEGKVFTVSKLPFSEKANPTEDNAQ